jgi:hypothetical protein
MSESSDGRVPVRMTRDRVSDSVFIRFTDEDIGFVGPGKSFLYSPPGTRGSFYLEFDAQWRLVSIEVLCAQNALRGDLLANIEAASDDSTD